MPVTFLTADHKTRYGRFTGEPSSEQLSADFFLDEGAREMCLAQRGGTNRMGYAVQLCTVRFLGTFLSDPREAPGLVVRHIGEQLSLEEPERLLSSYTDNQAIWRHQRSIRFYYGYGEFAEERLFLTRWLYTRAWAMNERHIVLFDRATARLVERKVLLPGATTLERLVSEVRERAQTRLFRRVSALVTPQCRAQLEAVLEVPDGQRTSVFDDLRRSPTRISAASLVLTIERLETIRALGVGTVDTSRFPQARLRVLARYANASWAYTIGRLDEARRLSTLLVWAQSVEVAAMDDALDILVQLIAQIFSRANRRSQEERIRTLRDLDVAARTLRDACAFLLDSSVNDTTLRDTIFGVVPRDNIVRAIFAVRELTHDPDDEYREELSGYYPQVRQFLKAVLEAIDFHPVDLSHPLPKALDYLRAIEHLKVLELADAPLSIVPKRWAKLVTLPNGRANRRFYTFCVLERLADALKRRDVFVSKSERWGDPRARLLSPEEWATSRRTLLPTLGVGEDPDLELVKLQGELEDAYLESSRAIARHGEVKVECIGGLDTLSLHRLEENPEPPSLVELRGALHSLLPKVNLPSLLLEICAKTNFDLAFSHVSDEPGTAKDLDVSICAVLLAEARNIGIEPIVRGDIPALTQGRLEWVRQNYFRAETLARANASLVDAQNRIPLAHAWGGGEVASADGLRFVVPVHTINAGPNSRYFGKGRGITYYSYTSDQFSGFHGIVIPGTLRDSLFILDGLLEHETTLRPTELMTDTAGYSDVVFGLFHLLGFQFSPRLRDLKDQRFWRFPGNFPLGALNGIARHRLNTDVIRRHWEDMLRIAASLKHGSVRASDFMRTLQSGGKTSSIAHAIGELGRIAKTRYLLAYIGDPLYRRRILTQLNRGEGRHEVARAVFSGQLGEVRKSYREGQEDQLGALGLVTNAIVLWNTLYMEHALREVRSQGVSARPEDIERLSPLLHRHINMHGEYFFELDETLRHGALRKLRVLDLENAASRQAAV